MKNLLAWIDYLLLAFMNKFYPLPPMDTPSTSPEIAPSAPPAPETPPTPAPVPPAPVAAPTYLWDTPANARHSVRVICDEENLTVYSKNVITACIDVESQFYNYLPNGKPTTHANPGSTDWGICQVNDYWHIGPHKDFPSIAFVMAHPDVVVRWMVHMMKQGHLNQWVSYSSGEYLKHMP